MKLTTLIPLFVFTVALLVGAINRHITVVHAQAVLPGPSCPDPDFVQKWNKVSAIAREIEPTWNELATASNEFVHTVEANPEHRAVRKIEIDSLWAKKRDIDDRLWEAWQKIRAHSCY
jgi:hypothetical protein